VRAMRNSLPTRDQLLMRIGAAKSEAGRAFGFVRIQLPEARQPVTRESFRFSVDKSKLKEAELRDGHYLLRSNADGEDPAVLWTRYVTIDADRSGVPLLEKRTGDPSGLPPLGTSRGRPYSGGVPGLLPASHTQESASASCTGADTRRRVGQTLGHSNDRRLGVDRR